MSKPSVVWLTLESTRFDHTSLSESQHNPTPALERIAERPDTTSFSTCFSHGIWTRPSSASILTGTYPSSHNVLDSTETLPDELPTLPDLLSDIGYNTIGFGTNGQLDSLCEDIGSFDEYIPNPVRKNLHKCAGISGLVRFLFQLRQHSAGYIKSITDVNGFLNTGYLMTEGIKKRIDSYDEPLFLYAHYKDPHTPYIPPIPYQREFTADLDVSREEAINIILDIRNNLFRYIAQGCPFSDTEWSVLTSLYNASLAYTDQQIGEVVDYIHSELDDPIVIITADHGDLLGEYDLLGHRLVTHDALCHIPLIISGPSKLVDYDGQIQHIDVVRTLLEEVGADTETLQGYDLRSESRDYSIIQRGEANAEKHLGRILEYNSDFDTSRFHQKLLTTIRASDFKYERSKEKERLYRIPDESANVASSHSSVVDMFREEYDSFFDDIREYDSIDKNISRQKKKQLQDMGYIVD